MKHAIALIAALLLNATANLLMKAGAGKVQDGGGLLADGLPGAVRAVLTLGRYPIAPYLSAIKVEPPDFQTFDEWMKGQPEEEIILKARE